MNYNKKIISLVLATTVAQSLIPTMAFADSSLDAHKASYGYYIDDWRNNKKENMTPESNPSIGVLSGYLKIFEPGSSWNNGKILDQDVHKQNIETVIQMTKGNADTVSTISGATQIYLNDRRN